MFGFSKIFALCATLIISASATEWNGLADHSALVERALVPGSSQSFQAPETVSQGSNCSAAFGEGYETCRPASDTEIRLCYNPTIGQVCCQNEWGCPSGSFCLTKNYCCPDGIDPATCASKYNVEVPTSIATADSGPYTPPAPPKTTYVETVTHSSPVYSTVTPTSFCTKPKPVTVVVTITPYPYSNGTTPHSGPTGSSAYGTGMPSASSTYVPYTGAAGSMAVSGRTLAASGLFCVLSALLVL